MTIIEALLLGLIQGITEFIPVSSSGHAAIIENLLHINSESGLLFEALAHLTVLAAVIGALRKEIKKLLMEFCRSMYDVYENVRIYFHNRDKKDARRYKKVISNNYRKLFLLLVIASIPTALESYILQDMTRLAGDNLLAPGMGLFITGIVLLVADFSQEESGYQEISAIGQHWQSALSRGLRCFRGFHGWGSLWQYVWPMDSRENLQ